MPQYIDDLFEEVMKNRSVNYSAPEKIENGTLEIFTDASDSHMGFASVFGEKSV